MSKQTAAHGTTTIAARLVALVAAASVPLLGFAGYLIHSNSRNVERTTVSSALAIARNVAAASDELLDASRAAVSQIAQRIGLGSPGGLACDPLVIEARAFMPRVLNVAVIDRDGNIACSALPARSDAFQPTEKYPWLGMTLRERKSVLAGPLIGPITGKWISLYSYPVLERDGNVGGAVLISIDLVDFPPVIRQAGLAPGWLAGIVDADGTIVSRSREPEKWIGTSIPMPVHKILADTKQAGHVEAAGADGVERLYGLARVPDSSWLAFAGIDAKLTREEYRRNLIALVALAAAVVVLAGVAAFVLARHISRPIRGMAEAARAVAAGQGSRRAPISGPREIRAFASEFNRMVEVRERAEAGLRELARRTRELSQKLATQEQSERRRINGELHDRLGQHLAILKLSLETIARQLPETTSAEVRTRLAEASGLAWAAISELRNVMADLRPPALDEHGLLAALRVYTGSLSTNTGLAISLEADERTPRLPIATETALFRIVQEALTNAAKHSGATMAHVRISYSDHALTLVVRDDGCGFEPFSADRGRSGWGLATMRERAEAIGADLRVTSQLGEGTSIVVEMELPAATQAPDG